MKVDVPILQDRFRNLGLRYPEVLKILDKVLDLLVCQRVHSRRLSLCAPVIRCWKLPLLAKLTHLLLLVSSDPEIGARVPRARQHKASFAV